MAKFFLAFFSVTLLISCVYSLSCYDCKDSKDEVCSNVVNCGKSANPNQQPACLKRITKENGGKQVRRSCAFVSAPNFDKAVECRPEDEVCLSCKEDKCNSAPTLGIFSIYTLLTLFASLILVH